jgi:hypothetical protein
MRRLGADAARITSTPAIVDAYIAAVRPPKHLKASAAMAAASATGGFGCVEIASAAPIVSPVVDKLSVRVLVDGAYNLFLRPG